MHKFGIVSKIRAWIFTERFDWWVYKTQPEKDNDWYIYKWAEFWDGYAALIEAICSVVEVENEREACKLFTNMDICKTYYFWAMERHGTKSDLIADCLYLLWTTPQEA